MSETAFTLDPRLQGETRPVISLPLCDVLLMNDARFPWLILVPRQAGKSEIADLSEADQARLWQEVNKAGAALRATARCDKLNIGALGNIVRQLHVHVVARCDGDAAWPGPVWGSGHALSYNDAERRRRIENLHAALTATH